MTNKVQKIREYLVGMAGTACCDAKTKKNIETNILPFIDSLQEEPVSIWHDVSEETPTQGSNILMIRKEEEDTNYPPIAGCFHHTNTRLDGRNWGYYNGFCYNEIEPPVKWAYIDDILKLSNVQRTVKNWKKELAREEIMEKVCQFIQEHHHEYTSWNTEEYELEFNTEQFIQDIKQAMKDE